MIQAQQPPMPRPKRMVIPGVTTRLECPYCGRARAHPSPTDTCPGCGSGALPVYKEHHRPEPPPNRTTLSTGPK